MMMLFWKALSALGGLAVTGPVGIAIAVWLFAGRTFRLSGSWCMLFCGGMLLVVITKVAYFGWGIGIPEWRFAGLSGHAMRACAVYPVAFYLAFRHARPVVKYGAFAGGVALALLISASRVPVLAHSVSEAVLGALVGLAVAAAFIGVARSAQPAVVGRVLVMLCLPVMIVMPFTKPAPTEKWMRQAARYMSGNEPVERAWRTGPDYERFQKEQQAI